MGEQEADRQRHAAAAAFTRAGLTAEELWLRYFALGGGLGLFEIEAYVDGVAQLPVADRDVVAHAVNERLDELAGGRRASYSRTLRDAMPRSAPLTSLTTLLEGAELAPPERLPALAADAGEALGTGFTVYLADYEQRSLRPVLAPGAAARADLNVETTLAGRSFRRLEVLPAEAEPPRLWVPLLDGAERLGVLEVEVRSAADLYDPGLRTHCRWAGMLLGHLVVLMTKYGDGLDVVRHQQRRTVSGELIWSVLPPLTAGVDGFIISAAVEPRHAVAGDAFDYSLSEATAQLLVLDAVGHDLRSGLLAATAVAAYRAARHAGNGLFEQARLVDETLSGEFGGAAYATAVLAEVDLRSGRLRYVNAGHPPPRIMRAGRVVKPLSGGRRMPLGLGPGREFSVGEEWLQPDDWLLLHTDGITEARDATGEFFGDDRLADFLEREAAAGFPPPETVRRLIQAVSAHQDGRFQDDATVLLARWTDPDDLVP
ncbi:PP2C family protein-serine/threonine phosphatase [Amycolatopsis sp. FDAARGOS 1241]|uniref:PP2C family protein-serine/threonine phosphatase n=1 Tax=Amycolatopsis sp. FDAARGOS 1241 TaxID=2778070 RepID=UPI0019520593|nr:PP2C family protein-serine/threonine phosphatase [Amycolatopsis sp. FDAARGOS 1241]QRP50070.1 serine/threonine-protein phosphatase [Amycolatopsis sp. FDAARGOS 1241]